MSTQCNINHLELLLSKFTETNKNNSKYRKTRKVVARFDNYDISSDGGIALLREVERRLGIARRLGNCFTDHRKQNLITHSVDSMVKQRVLGICCGHEDVADHDEFRNDSMAQLFCGTSSPLAGKSTMRRMEVTEQGADQSERYKKVEADFDSIDRLLVDLFVESMKKPPETIVLDIDITDDPLHGNQEGRGYNGYYGCYCYAPSYVFCGRHMLGCRLRESNQDSAAGALDELSRIVFQIREKWQDTQIIIRADAGFCREEIMRWRKLNGIDYVLGMAGTSRLTERVKKEMGEARDDCIETAKASRRFKSFMFRTLNSWSSARRVVCKAEHLPGGPNTRFTATSLKPQQYDAGTLYEKLYCARGEMENRIKAQQPHLFSDRTSTSYMRSNQMRMYFSAFACILLERFREKGLKGTRYAMAQCDTIRLKFIKVGTVVSHSFRRIALSFSQSYPYGDLFRQALRKLMAVPPPSTF